MVLCLDVQYEELAAVTACVGFEGWSDANATMEFVERTASVPEPYQPGQFYERELTHLVRVVERVRRSMEVEVVIIDGHVWLDEGKPGLGAHLYRALGEQVAIIGVAKSAFHGGVAIPVLRGQSRRPLFVTAVGMEGARAAELVRGMEGPHRIPTHLRRADQLARGHERPDPARALDSFDHG